MSAAPPGGRPDSRRAPRAGYPCRPARAAALEWLLADPSPSLRCRVLRELLAGCEDGDREAAQAGARAASRIPDSEPVRRLLESMHPEGYWLQRNPRTGRRVGDGVEYGAFGTTHFCLAYLAELGLDRGEPRVARAAERYLSLQSADGDWYRHFSCLLGLNVRTLIRLGYREDPRLRRSIDLLLNTDRPDGGYLCDLHEAAPGRRRPKSCIRGSVKALLALSELAEVRDHPRCRRLADYFLNRGGLFRSGAAAEAGVACADLERISFPITWRANGWEVLLALGRMGYGGDERLTGAWRRLEGRADEAGRYPLDWTPAQCPWKVGRRGEPNPWVTFYVLLARRLRGDAPVRGGPA